MPYVSVRAYAKHRGCSNTAVHKQIEKGRLIGCLRKNPDSGFVEIDPEVADREWAANADPATTILAALNAEQDATGDFSGEENDLMRTSGAFANARAEREKWTAATAKLEYEERSGKLVDAERIRKEAFNLARQVRDSMMNIPDRVATELAAELDSGKIHSRLCEEISTALRTIISVNA